MSSNVCTTKVHRTVNYLNCNLDCKSFKHRAFPKFQPSIFQRKNQVLWRYSHDRMTCDTSASDHWVRSVALDRCGTWIAYPMNEPWTDHEHPWTISNYIYVCVCVCIYISQNKVEWPKTISCQVILLSLCAFVKSSTPPANGKELKHSKRKILGKTQVASALAVAVKADPPVKFWNLHRVDWFIGWSGLDLISLGLAGVLNLVLLACVPLSEKQVTQLAKRLHKSMFKHFQTT